MKERIKIILLRLGHFQAQLLLTLLFILVLSPYAMFLRLFGQAHLPDGRWQPVEQSRADLPGLRRTF